MQFTTSGNNADTSFPTVIEAITFFTASFFFSFFSLLSSDLSSNISPFFVVVKYFESVILSIYFVAKRRRRGDQNNRKLSDKQSRERNRDAAHPEKARILVKTVGDTVYDDTPSYDTSPHAIGERRPHAHVEDRDRKIKLSKWRYAPMETNP